MIHMILFTIGVVLVTISVTYFVRKIDYIETLLTRYDLYFSSRSVSIQGPAGIAFNLSVAKNDRAVAWKIYSQLNSRVAAVEFNPDYDSALNVHQSLYKMFEIIRDEVANIPLEKIQRDDSDDTVKFYLAIMNDGLRPHLSKWHIPLSKWVENEQKNHPERSILEIERQFPQRKELLDSLKAMNERMQVYSTKLLEIVKSK